MDGQTPEPERSSYTRGQKIGFVLYFLFLATNLVLILTGTGNDVIRFAVAVLIGGGGIALFLSGLRR